jgi:hypothetical protein
MGTPADTPRFSTPALVLAFCFAAAILPLNVAATEAASAVVIPITTATLNGTGTAPGTIAPTIHTATLTGVGSTTPAAASDVPFRAPTTTVLLGPGALTALVSAPPAGTITTAALNGVGTLNSAGAAPLTIAPIITTAALNGAGTRTPTAR